MLCDPFALFASQVESVNIVKYAAPGLASVTVAGNVPAIIKRAQSSDLPAQVGNMTTARSFHLKPSALPDTIIEDPEQLVGLIIVTKSGRAYQINDASRGDDMSLGKLMFIHATAYPYGKSSL